MNSAARVTEQRTSHAAAPGPVPMRGETGPLRKNGEAASVERRGSSQFKALRSSALIGASSIIEIGIRVIRSKVLALLVGPSGIGLLGLYTTLQEIVRNLAGLGLNTSGVRQIAEAAGECDPVRLARTAIALNRLAFGSGALGAIILLICSRSISRWTFGNEQHTNAIAVLALAAFLADLADARAAVLQGLHRIGDLARTTVWGALLGTLSSAVVVYFWRERGLAPSVVASAAATLLLCWWYGRRLGLPRVAMNWQETIVEFTGLARLGLAFMASGFMLMGSAYLVRIIVLRQLGVSAAGYYQAAWALGGFYTAVVLKAMTSDFYPRLTAVAKSNPDCNRLANEQAEVVILVACPGVLATLVFAPVMIRLFYSADFSPSIEILRWICLGTLLKIANWSMGFIVLAKGRQLTFFVLELLSNVLLVGFVWLGVRGFGLVGSGIGFSAMYGTICVVTYFVVNRLSGFRLSMENTRLLFGFVPVMGGVFAAGYFLDSGTYAVVGLTATLASAAYSARLLLTMLPPDRLPPLLRRWTGASPPRVA